eukprot:gene56693-75705_t
MLAFAAPNAPVSAEAAIDHNYLKTRRTGSSQHGAADQNQTNQRRTNADRNLIMKTLILSTLAAAGLALSVNTAFATDINGNKADERATVLSVIQSQSAPTADRSFYSVISTVVQDNAAERAADLSVVTSKPTAIEFTDAQKSAQPRDGSRSVPPDGAAFAIQGISVARIAATISAIPATSRGARPSPKIFRETIQANPISTRPTILTFAAVVNVNATNHPNDAN